MADTQNEIDEAEAKLQSLYHEQEGVLISLNQIKLEQEGVQAGINRLKNSQDKIQGDIDSMNAELDTVTTAKAGLVSQISDLKEQINIAVGDLESAKKHRDEAVSEEAASLQDLRVQQDKVVNDSKVQVDILNAQKIDLEKQITPLADQLSRLTDRIMKFNAQIDSLNKAITEATSVLKDLNEKQIVAKQSLEDLQAKSDALTAEITNKIARSASLDTEIAAKQTELNDTQKEVDDVLEVLKTNNQYNVDFLKMRAGLIAGQQEVDERLAFLRQKYGDIGETW